MNILYYITCHGYGHGVRSSAICNYFSPKTNLFLRTNLPVNFFKEEITRPFTYLKDCFDCGCLQNSVVDILKNETLKRYAEIAELNKDRISNELQLIKDLHIDCIVSDITPFAFEVAQRAQIPCIGATNFTWYDIYKDYTQEYSWFEPYLEEIKRQYASGYGVLALDTPNEMSYFSKVIKVPAVGRIGVNCRKRIYDHFRIPEENNLALIYIGEFGLKAKWEQLAQFKNWDFLGLQTLENTPSNYHVIDKSVFRYQDLIASVDLMICKMGYGAFSECVLHQKPMIYLPRPDFAEFPVLSEASKKKGFGIEISYEKFVNLNLQKEFEMVLSDTMNIIPSQNGAPICAEIIENLGNRVEV